MCVVLVSVHAHMGLKINFPFSIFLPLKGFARQSV